MHHLAKIVLFILILAAPLGCMATGTEPARPVRLEPLTQTGPSSPAQPESGARAAAALVWEDLSSSGGAEICQSLRLTDQGQLWLGPCKTAANDVEFRAFQNQEWPEILDRFAAFDYSEPEERLHFEGRGEVAGPAWQRAIVAWSRFTYLEQAAVYGSGPETKTVLSWYMGQAPDRPGYCRHLTVLVYGYAYAEFAPCEGSGDLQERVGDWLETAEWEQFDGWLYSRGLTEQGHSYFSGHGTEELTELELANLNDWAAVVYDRLAQQ
jgi:hypothetical protein